MYYIIYIHYCDTLYIIFTHYCDIKNDNKFYFSRI